MALLFVRTWKGSELWSIFFELIEIRIRLAINPGLARIQTCKQLQIQDIGIHLY